VCVCVCVCECEKNDVGLRFLRLGSGRRRKTVLANGWTVTAGLRAFFFQLFLEPVHVAAGCGRENLPNVRNKARNEQGSNSFIVHEIPKPRFGSFQSGMSSLKPYPTNSRRMTERDNEVSGSGDTAHCFR